MGEYVATTSPLQLGNDGRGLHNLADKLIGVLAIGKV